MSELPLVLVIDCGSQVTLRIAKILEEIRIRCAVLAPKPARRWLKKNPVKAIILSGGEASVYDKNAPQPPDEIFKCKTPTGKSVPILGICYGMQWLARKLGGQVEAPIEHRKYGRDSVVVCSRHSLFTHTPKQQVVWMSHGDSVAKVPSGFTVLAKTKANTIAAMAKGHVYGVQFHPEVTHTDYGREILTNFLNLAGCKPDWHPLSQITAIQKAVLRKVGARQRCVIGFSGGVDSTTLAAILSPVLQDRLVPITIDGGQLREGELTEIKQNAQTAKVNTRIIDARGQFAKALANVTDAERKRKKIKRIYRNLLVQAAKQAGALFVIQGTLASDKIESGKTGGAKIKSHHNVGLDMGNLKQLHPLENLFKYEVRELAKEGGLPRAVYDRQPFPGPGLFIRVVETPVTPATLDVVRWADAQVTRILRKRRLYNRISQLVVAYAGTRTVGVKGDARVYGHAIIVRGVNSADFMTASAVHFSDAAQQEINSVLSTHPKIVRVWYDTMDKPPATTEME